MAPNHPHVRKEVNHLGRILKMSLVSALLLTSAAFAANPPASTFHPERYGRELELGSQVDCYQIHWTVNFHDFLDEQTEKLRIDVEKFKPVRFAREEPLSTVERGTIQVEPIHYPSVEFAAARW